MKISKSFLTFLFSVAYCNCAELTHDLRDPFCLKVNKQEITLVSILSDQTKKTAIVEYDDESMLVSLGDLIGLNWKVISIGDKEINIENLETKKREVVVLNYD